MTLIITKNTDRLSITPASYKPSLKAQFKKTPIHLRFYTEVLTFAKTIPMRTIIIIAIALFFSTAAFAQQKIAAQFPKASFAGKSSGEVTADEIITAGELLSTNSELKVKSFTMTFNFSDKPVSASSKSSKLTESMKGYLKELKSGQKVTVENIETVKADGVVIKLEPLIFILK
jgi:hypothetical protein